MKARPIIFNAEMVRALLDGRKTQTRRCVTPLPGLQYCHGTDHHETPPEWLFSSQTTDEINAAMAGKHTWRRCPYGVPGDRHGTKWADSAPPESGWYHVRWEPGDDERLIWLIDSEWGWLWAESEAGDPEAIGLDIPDPGKIEWRRPGDRLWVRETWLYAPGSGEGPIYRADPWADEMVAKWRTDPNFPQLRWRPSIHMPRWASRITLDVVDVRVERVTSISDKDAIAEGVLDVAGSWPVRDFETLWDSINGKKPGRDWASNPFVWVVEFRVVP